MVAPTAGTAFYGVEASLPIIAGTIMMAAVTAFVFVHPPLPPVARCPTPV